MVILLFKKLEKFGTELQFPERETQAKLFIYGYMWQHDFFVFRLTWDERERESFCVGIFVGHVVDGGPKG